MEQNIAEIIKNRLLPSTIIGQKVKLKKTGHNYIGLCPFHNERSPSFNVNDEKKIYHCFGCSAGGDIINFVMEYEKIDFLDACETLAKIAGVNWTKKEYEKIDQTQTINNYKILEQAVNWFHNNLNNSVGNQALDYFRKRNLSKETLDKFKIGYAPKSNNLLTYLKSIGYQPNNLKELGLVASNAIGEFFDYFRDRVIFPIYDIQNRPVGFGARTLSNQQPKYLNSPETILFKKSEILYGENLARKSAITHNKVIVVEGYMDLIALSQAGISNVVATLGTAITSQHLLNLWKYVDEPIICLDGDNSGQKAMYKVAELALALITEGKSLKFCFLPAGQDPDDIINSEGKAYFEKLINNTLPLSEIIWKIEQNKITESTPEQIAALEKNLSNLEKKITNISVRNRYKDFFNKKIWQNYKANNKKTYYQKNLSKEEQKILLPSFVKINIIERLELVLVAQIIECPKLLDNIDIYEEIVRINFINLNLSNLRNKILEIKDKDNIKQELEKSGFSKEVATLCGKNSLYLDKVSNFSEEELIIKWQLCFKKYILALLNQEYKNIIRHLTNEAQIKANSLHEQILSLENEIKKLEYNFSLLDDE